MTRSKNIRLYRACQRCRQRKLKCEPITLEDPSWRCFECLRAGQECKPAGSRRGGNLRAGQVRSPPTVSQVVDQDRANTAALQGRGQSEETIYPDLQTPCDALQMLAKLAATDATAPSTSLRHNSTSDNGTRLNVATSPDYTSPNRELGSNQQNVNPNLTFSSGLFSEAGNLVKNLLGHSICHRLIQRYAQDYHSFCPLAPKKMLKETDIDQLVVDEPFLLTVILTIASKDNPELRAIHQHCWNSLKTHMMDIFLAAPSSLNVGSVEGLILLSEWIPYNISDYSLDDHIYQGNISVVEDNMGWSLIGQAIRHAYLLRLDKVSFREVQPGISQELAHRHRLAWIFVYISDRQVSVRMGQSFWSRGPALSARFTAKDFPTLQSVEDSHHLYASVLDASLELTQILHNTHDLLYSNKPRMAEMMRRGDYNPYLDELRHALSLWRNTWGKLEPSPKLYSTLRIFSEYVCLYINAFSFQSILSRFYMERAADHQAGLAKPSSLLFPRGILGSADGVHLFEAINAARNILFIAIETDPVAHIRYMPFRFYVYTIYAAVFLHKADIFGAFSEFEHSQIVDLVRGYIRVLNDAATGPSHIGHRYNKLLEKLWFNEEVQTTTATTTVNSQNYPLRNTSQSMSQQTVGSMDNSSSFAAELPPSFRDMRPENMIDELNPFLANFTGLDGYVFNTDPETDIY